MSNKSLNCLLVMFCVIYCAVVVYMYNGFQGRVEHLSQLNHKLIQFARQAAALLNGASDEALLSNALFGFLPVYDSEATASAFSHIVDAVNGEFSLRPSEPEPIDAYSMALPVQIEFTGSLNGALTVMGLIETEGQLVRIGTVKLTRTAEGIASPTVKLSANMRLIFARAFTEDAAIDISKNIASASESLAVPQRKMRSDVLLQAISHIKNPFQRSIANLSLKSVIPWKDNEFAAVLELETGESFTLAPGESFKGIELASSSADKVVVSMLGRLFTLVSSP